MSAKFITAPDNIPESTRRKILIIDASWQDIETLTLLCMTRNVNLDFYIFGPTSIITEWLDTSLALADDILINKTSERIGLNDNVVLNDPRTNLFGIASCKYATPLDFVVEIIKKENNETTK